MITAGVDIGSTTSKAVILENDSIIGSVIGESTTNPKQIAKDVFYQGLAISGVGEKDVSCIIGTGYGRAKVDFADENISELSCHARGAFFLLPSVRTVIDIGGQDTKVLSLDEKGGLLEFGMNDKCAAGTGRFLDFIARTINITTIEMASLHFEGRGSVALSNMCSVFIESEVINLINEGVELSHIVRGLHASVASRVVSQAKRVGVLPDIVITGGVAKNGGVVAELEERIGIRLKAFPDGIDPQLIGALGAAVIAKEKASKIK